MTRKKLLSIIAFPLFLASIFGIYWIFHEQINDIFSSSESIRIWIEKKGIVAPLAFLGLQILQVVIFIIPGELVQIAGGYAFGLWTGFLLSILGILLGSLVNFFMGRILGRPFVSAVLGEERMKKVDSFTAKGNTTIGFFLLFMIPGIPKDILTYAAGSSKLSFFVFIIISTVGRIPGILGSSYMGSSVSEKNYTGAIIILAFAVVLFVLGLVFRKPLNEKLEAFIAKHSPKNDN